MQRLSLSHEQEGKHSSHQPKTTANEPQPPPKCSSRDLKNGSLIADRYVGRDCTSLVEVLIQGFIHLILPCKCLGPSTQDEVLQRNAKMSRRISLPHALRTCPKSIKGSGCVPLSCFGRFPFDLQVLPKSRTGPFIVTSSNQSSKGCFKGK